MTTISQRNYALDWLKGWMIIAVILLHTWLLPEFRGHLGVDVFFFISGFFLMHSYSRKKRTAVQYTWSRIQQLSLPYFICLAVACLMHAGQFLSIRDLDDIVRHGAEVVSAFSFMSEFGVILSRDQLLIGSWYFSVLIIASFLLYGMLKYNEKLTLCVLFPAIILFGFNSIIDRSASFSSWERIGYLGIPLIRGTSEMAAGSLINAVYYRYKNSINKYQILINIVGTISLVLFVFMFFAKQDLDKYLVIFLPWILLSFLIDQSWLNTLLARIKGDPISRIGKYTLYILCAHFPAYMLVFWCNEHLLNHRLDGIPLAFVLLVFAALATVLLYFICQWIRSTILTRKR